MSIAREMPRYKCHKEVWALRIRTIRFERPGDGAWITPFEPGYAEIHLDQAFLSKHEVVAGGYYVVYEDGYKSFSPQKAFEDGYSLITSKQLFEESKRGF